MAFNYTSFDGILDNTHRGLNRTLGTLGDLGRMFGGSVILGIVGNLFSFLPGATIILLFFVA